MERLETLSHVGCPGGLQCLQSGIYTVCVSARRGHEDVCRLRPSISIHAGRCELEYLGIPDLWSSLQTHNACNRKQNSHLGISNFGSCDTGCTVGQVLYGLPKHVEAFSLDQ